MKKEKKKVSELEKQLRRLEISTSNAKNRLMFNKNMRIYGKLVEFFGFDVSHNSELYNHPIDVKTVDLFSNTVKVLLTEKYGPRLIPSKFVAEEPKIEETKVEDVPATELEVIKVRESDSTFIPKYADQTCTLLKSHCNQELAARTLWDNFSEKGYTGQLLLAPTGSGKTYILGAFLKNFIEQGYIKKLGCISPWPILYVTKAPIVEQTKKVFKNEFGIDTVNTVHVVNIELLRSALGSLFVKETLEIVNGQEHTVYSWNQWMHPCLFIWDECQILAREDSIQSQIANAVNQISLKYSKPDRKVAVYQISASATPFAKVSEAKHFTCSTGVEFEYGLMKTKVKQSNWTTFANMIAAPGDPSEYNTESIKRYVDFMEPYIVRINNIRPKHKAFNKTVPITFETKEQQDEYNKALEHYYERKRKIEGDDAYGGGQGNFALLAEFTIFRKAAEKIRAPYLARRAHEIWHKEGKAPAIACAFKGTMLAVYMSLVNDYGWSRDDVSFIWGGSTESLNAKQKMSKRVKEAGLESMLKDLNISLADLGLSTDFVEKTDEQYQFEKAHNLLSQKPDERERERMRYQRQDSKLLLFSFKSGGVGLSAHHEIKYPNARPRKGLFTPVYSEKELIQAFGRLPRITSISDTDQEMVFYVRTIEQDVAARVVHKLKCMRQVVRARESWEDIITGRKLEEENIDEDEVIESEDLVSEYAGKE